MKGRRARIAGRRGPRGLTLAEAAVTIALVAIIAAVAAPRFGGSIDRRRADGAAQRVVADLTAAQQYARRTGTSIAIQFDTSAHVISFTGMNDPDHPTTKYVSRLGEEPHLATLGPVSVKGGNAFTFDGYGDPDGGGTVTLRVGSEQRVITIDSSTGRAYLP